MGHFAGCSISTYSTLGVHESPPLAIVVCYLVPFALLAVPSPVSPHSVKGLLPYTYTPLVPWSSLPKYRAVLEAPLLILLLCLPHIGTNWPQPPLKCVKNHDFLSKEHPKSHFYCRYRDALGAHDFRGEGTVTYVTLSVQFCMGQVSPAWGKVPSLKHSVIPQETVKTISVAHFRQNVTYT